MIKRSTIEATILVLCLAYIVGSCIYLMSQKPEPKHCECKCFTAGYLQACEDFDNLMDN